MRTFFLSLLACTIFSYTALSQGISTQEDELREFQARNQEAAQLMMQKENRKALVLLQSLVKHPALQIHQTAKPSILYNMACCYSLLGDRKNAVGALRGAVEEGYANIAHIKEDTDLDSIRGEAGYQDLVTTLKQQLSRSEFTAFKTSYRENITDNEKVAGLSLIWSEARHNFANFAQVPGLNWDSLYLAFLSRVAKTTSTEEYYRVLQEFTARLGDGHTGVYPPTEVRKQYYGLPLQTALIEEKVLVVAVDSDSLRKSGIAPGLEVTRIEGAPVRQHAQEQIVPYQSASTPQDLASRTYGQLFRSTSPGPVRIEFKDAKGHSFTRDFGRVPFRYPNPPALEFRMLRGGVAYLALNTFMGESVVRKFDSLFVKIKGSAALILDIRNNGGGNSSVGWDLLTYLTDKAFETSRWKTRENRAVYSAWGLGERWYGEPAELYKMRSGEPFRKPVVVLTSPRTYSAAEDFAVAFDAMKRGTIIGEATGGSTGQPLMFPLPGGGGVRICAKHDEYPDGKEFVGVGVQPAIHVQPTVADLRAGRDTVLEAALDFLARGRALAQPD